MERPDRKTLEWVMRSMTTNDRQLQRAVLSRYITDDIKFIHFLGDVKGKDQYYGMYRSAVTGIDYKLIFIDMLISDELVMAWVDLNIKLAPFYIKRYHAPTIVMLRLRKCPDGLYRIYEQIDHHSVFAFVWALGWPFSTISDNITRPICGWLLATGGWSVDTLQDAATAAWVLYTRTLGKAAKAVLPKSWLESLPDLVAQPLGITQEPLDSSAESVAIQQVLRSINGLFQASGLGDISQAVAGLGADDGLSSSAITDSATAARAVDGSSSRYSSGISVAAAASGANGSSDLSNTSASDIAAGTGGYQAPTAAAAAPAGVSKGVAPGDGPYTAAAAPRSTANKAAAALAAAKSTARDTYAKLKNHA